MDGRSLAMMHAQHALAIKHVRQARLVLQHVLGERSGVAAYCVASLKMKLLCSPLSIPFPCSATELACLFAYNTLTHCSRLPNGAWHMAAHAVVTACAFPASRPRRPNLLVSRALIKSKFKHIPTVTTTSLGNYREMPKFAK